MASSLFGLSRSNRDFSQSDAWGKNQFNSSFPAALCCYMAHLGLPAKYLSIQNLLMSHLLFYIIIRDKKNI